MVKAMQHYVKLNNEIANALRSENVATVNLRSINVKDYALTQQRLAKAKCNILLWKEILIHILTT